MNAVVERGGRPADPGVGRRRSLPTSRPIGSHQAIDVRDVLGDEPYVPMDDPHEFWVDWQQTATADR